MRARALLYLTEVVRDQDALAIRRDVGAQVGGEHSAASDSEALDLLVLLRSLVHSKDRTRLRRQTVVMAEKLRTSVQNFNEVVRERRLRARKLLLTASADALFRLNS